MKAGRLRSRARIWRPEEAKSGLRQTLVTWVDVGRCWLEVRPPRRMLKSFGAGEQPEGTMEGELRTTIDLQARDVLEIYGGPEKGTRWRAISPPYRSGRGDLVILLEAYTGDLVEAEEEEP